MLNCKEGDLAIIVGNDSGYGRLCAVVSGVFTREDIGDFRVHWECDTLGQKIPLEDGTYSDGVETLDIPDENLRPIRDQDGEDEILRIAGKPELEKCKL